MKYELTFTLSRIEGGGRFIVRCDQSPGARASGRTVSDALLNLAEAWHQASGGGSKSEST